MHQSYYKKFFEEPKAGFFKDINRFDPDNINTLGIYKENDCINIKFQFVGSKWVRETIPWDSSPTHFNLKVFFFWEIICEGIKEYNRPNNIEDFYDFEFRISKSFFSRTKIITLSNTKNNEKVIIKCRKMSFKNNHFEEFGVKDGKLIPLSDIYK